MKISEIAVVTFGLLTLSIITLWIPKRSSYIFPKGLDLWIILFISSLVFGLYAKFVHVIALIPIIVFAISCKIFGDNSYNQRARSISAVFILVILVGMIAHIIPGFFNPKIISNLRITKEAIPYTLYLNFDKTLIGLFILAFCHRKLSSKTDWIGMLKSVWLKVILIILSVMITALAIKYVQIEI